MDAFNKIKNLTKDGLILELNNIQKDYDSQKKSFEILQGKNLKIQNELTSLKKELKDSEEKFRLLFDNMDEGFALHQLVKNEKGEPVDYKIVDVNLPYEIILGIPVKKARGALASKLYGANEAPYLKEYAEVVKNKKALSRLAGAFYTYFGNSNSRNICISNECLAGFDGDAFRFDFLGLGDVQRQNAFVIAGFHGVAVHQNRESHTAAEAAITALTQMVLFLVDFLVIFNFALNGQNIVFQRDFQVVGINARDRGFDDVTIFVFDDVQGQAPVFGIAVKSGGAFQHTIKFVEQVSRVTNYRIPTYDSCHF